MNVPDHLFYTNDHEWAEVDMESGHVKVGITEYAQDALGDIVFVQLPEIGAKVQLGLMFCEVESTKSVSDIYAPVTGVVVERNDELADAPQRLNEDPYGRGWICIVEAVADATYDHLLNAESYRNSLTLQ